MKKNLRYVPKVVDDAPHLDLFRSAEEAWFWFALCQHFRGLNKNASGAPSLYVRPCEPDDIYLIAMRLHRKHILHRQHLQILARYGLAQRSPDPRCDFEKKDRKLWREALDHLTVELRAKGIVEPSGLKG